MTDLVISQSLAQRLQTIAAQEGRSVEETLTFLLDRYGPQDAAPGSTIPDAAIEIPADVSDADAYRSEIRRMRSYLYQRARDYWRRVGNADRLALTNAELDQQFWRLYESVPYLKADQGTVEIPPDPLDGLIGLFSDSELTNISATETQEQLRAEHYHKRESRWES